MNSIQGDVYPHRLGKVYRINCPKRGYLMNTTPNNNTMNSDTKIAFEEVKQMSLHTEKYKTYSSFTEILNEIDSEIANEEKS